MEPRTSNSSKTPDNRRTQAGAPRVSGHTPTRSGVGQIIIGPPSSCCCWLRVMVGGAVRAAAGVGHRVLHHPAVSYASPAWSNHSPRHSAMQREHQPSREGLRPTDAAARVPQSDRSAPAIHGGYPSAPLRWHMEAASTAKHFLPRILCPLRKARTIMTRTFANEHSGAARFTGPKAGSSGISRGGEVNTEKAAPRPPDGSPLHAYRCEENRIDIVRQIRCKRD